MAPVAPVDLPSGKPTCVTLLASATVVTYRNAVRLPPPGMSADFRDTQRRLAYRPGARTQVMQVLLDPEQVRVRQLVRGRDGLFRASAVGPAWLVPGHRRAHHGERRQRGGPAWSRPADLVGDRIVEAGQLRRDQPKPDAGGRARVLVRAGQRQARAAEVTLLRRRRRPQPGQGVRGQPEP